MAEACTVSHAENKRSLPAWMLKACSGNQVVKIEDQNKQALESAEQIGARDQTKPIKRKSERLLKNVDSEGAGEVGVLQRCESREKARRKSKDAVRDEVEETEIAASKNPRKVSAKAAPKNSRKRKLENVKSEASSPVAIDDEIELTMEDLVSIAEEYVNADKQKQNELETVKTARCKEHLPCPTISTEADTGGSVVNAQSMKGLMPCTTVTTNTRPSQHRGADNKGHQELMCSSSLETTGDVAQEMLNLFLGPLLSKPADYGNRSEYIESITANVNHLPEKKDLHNEVPRQGEAVTKKKSSLKDKLALLF
ncbi:uncharacterized protein LOC133903630 [Phragmites australis]|uniref:uncharacterized protein LOC133903630 n=1 Tax=Phragmites australis TaxID=29695 RepID=UPI002D765E70|nr:uncharacterized protein LOC133903630 [Phragmites australis]XP_062201042.1 uncharacterized protein LOC133903630 [Phragmites australis]XP_062201043.1 uncharacterized protein LOC133903630 [Phragmites australis]XP_062201044.1 uncharacterized protein LOC133903630 [Phragmites australis]